MNALVLSALELGAAGMQLAKRAAVVDDRFHDLIDQRRVS